MFLEFLLAMSVLGLRAAGGSRELGLERMLCADGGDVASRVGLGGLGCDDEVVACEGDRAIGVAGDVDLRADLGE